MSLIADYQALHENTKRFPGFTLQRYIDDVVPLVEETRPRSLLDWGCGKGYQYLGRRLHERWGGLLPVCYDPGVRQLAEKPSRTFDGVLSTDVLEHVPEPEVDAAVAEILGFLGERDDGLPNMLFLSIACRPSKKNPLPGGGNAHVTIRHPQWWFDTIFGALPAPRMRKTDIQVEIRFDIGETYPSAPDRYSSLWLAAP